MEREDRKNIREGGVLTTLTCEDNMALMARYPENYFELAICDPEYGIGASKPSIKPCLATQKKWY